MNERIKELEAQCWEPKQYGPPWFNSQKFAELIVAECAHVAVFKDDGMIATAEVAGYMAAGRATAARVIKKHFGVDK
jgi:hypothetical protein